jgi:hypothetical protein
MCESDLGGRRMNLYELQRWMKWIISDPRGVENALAGGGTISAKHRTRYEQPMPSGLSLISVSEDFPAARRLGIYAEAYFSRIVESMEADYPRLRSVLGEVQFQKLMAEYLKAFPSKTHNIGEVGRHLPKFVADYPVSDELPFLSELANLEWQSIESFYAPAEDLFDSSMLGGLDDSDWAELQVKISSSVRLLRSKWPLEKFWPNEGLESENWESGSVSDSFLLWRRAGEVRFAKLAAWEGAALEGLGAGDRLTETMGRVSEQYEVAPAQVSDAFGRWLQDGLIAGINSVFSKT